MSGKKSKKKARTRPGAAPGSIKKTPASSPAVRRTMLVLIVLLLAAVSIGAGLGIAPKDSPKAYQAAIDHYDDFAKIPCYCGCGKSAGHDSLQMCFIQSMSGSNIKYDNHGAG